MKTKYIKPQTEVVKLGLYGDVAVDNLLHFSKQDEDDSDKVKGEVSFKEDASLPKCNTNIWDDEW